MKFIHIADAHLDSPFLGLSFLPSKQFSQIKEATSKSFERTVDAALAEKVDLFLIAGDTFDSVHPSPKSQLFLNNQLQRLVDAQIQVVMVLGNHDYLAPEQMILPQSPFFKLLGADQNIEIFKAQTQNGYPYQVIGFSYRQNHIRQDLAQEFPVKADDRFTFGLMHAGMKTSAESQNNYAPFTLSELQQLNYNYFALGHIHLRQVLSKEPLIVYSGNLQGRHINEQGAKGYYLGTIDEGSQKTKLDFHATAPIIWKMVEVDLKQTVSQTDLLQIISQKLAENNQMTTLMGLTINGAQNLTDDEVEIIKDPATWQQISAHLNYDSQLVKVYFKDNQQLRLSEADTAAFLQAETEIMSDSSLQHLASSLGKKSATVNGLLEKDSFLEEIKELAQVKLGHDLKDFNDEIN